jgi:hypothetical protein
MALFLFISWVLLSETVRNKSFSIDSVFQFILNKIFSSSLKNSEASTFQSTVTEVSTLLTFCPPAPLLREVLKLSSFEKFFIV